MRRFFAQLADDMAGGPNTVGGDVVAVLGALVLAVTPDDADRLAAALGRPPDRVAAALHDAEQLTR
ncbi:hypothetical protein [Saccharothrix hoggarensis]